MQLDLESTKTGSQLINWARLPVQNYSDDWMSWDPTKYIFTYLRADKNPSHTNEIGVHILRIRGPERGSKVIMEDRVPSSMLCLKGLKCPCTVARCGHFSSWSWSLDFKKHIEKSGRLVKKL